MNRAELLIKNYAPARRDTLDYYINDETLIVLKPNNIKQSIGICKEFATQENTLRMENREMMSEMFVKLDIRTATNK